jgi:hypothetical protein
MMMIRRLATKDAKGFVDDHNLLIGIDWALPAFLNRSKQDYF